MIFGLLAKKVKLDFLSIGSSLAELVKTKKTVRKQQPTWIYEQSLVVPRFTGHTSKIEKSCN